MERHVVASAGPRQALESRRQRVVLIGCDADTGQSSALCQQLMRRLLELGEFEVVVHAGKPPAAARAEALPPVLPACLRTSVETLERLLATADIFVSSGRDGLVRGCRAGLKPVQIGSAVEGSETFSHIFPDIGRFVAAAPGLRGELSIGEYESFRCSPLAASDRARARPLAKLREAAGGIMTAISNPAAVLRFARAAVSEWRVRSR